MSAWKEISAGQQFNGIQVFERPDAKGGAYSVVFQNREPWPQSHHLIYGIVSLALGAGTFAGFALLPAELISIPVALLWAFIIGVPAAGFYLQRPRKVTRTIVLDRAANRFRVLRNNKPTYERPLGMFNLSVDDHPDLEVERNERREKQQKGPGPLEKQHCLIGWFGPEGAQRVELVYRVEWPKRYSLQEVAGAVNWMIKHVTDSAKAATPAPAAEREAEGEPAARRGMNPPLD